MNAQDLRNHIAAQCGFKPNKAEQGEAVQVCSAGEWPEDHGGNFDPTRREANFAFSDWLDSQQGDSLPEPTSFSDWISQNEDSIIE